MSLKFVLVKRDGFRKFHKVEWFVQSFTSEKHLQELHVLDGYHGYSCSSISHKHLKNVQDFNVCRLPKNFDFDFTGPSKMISFICLHTRRHFKSFGTSHHACFLSMRTWGHEDTTKWRREVCLIHHSCITSDIIMSFWRSFNALNAFWYELYKEAFRWRLIYSEFDNNHLFNLLQWHAFWWDLLFFGLVLIGVHPTVPRPFKDFSWNTTRWRLNGWTSNRSLFSPDTRSVFFIKAILTSTRCTYILFAVFAANTYTQCYT